WSPGCKISQVYGFISVVAFWRCSGDSDSIKVFVRVRPLTQGTGLTTDGDQSLCLTVTSPNTIRLLSKPEPRTFTYDHVADMDTSQVWGGNVALHCELFWESPLL
uniref:Kinesin motor domain-containing protein n=1 Tax=Stegastes partitus TaxID=144197 RepID=A0A3B5ASN8_9TELE